VERNYDLTIYLRSPSAVTILRNKANALADKSPSADYYDLPAHNQ
jgi:hypothetical protein